MNAYGELRYIIIIVITSSSSNLSIIWGRCLASCPGRLLLEEETTNIHSIGSWVDIRNRTFWRLHKSLAPDGN